MGKDLTTLFMQVDSPPFNTYSTFVQNAVLFFTLAASLSSISKLMKPKMAEWGDKKKGLLQRSYVMKFEKIEDFLGNIVVSYNEVMIQSSNVQYGKTNKGSMQDKAVRVQDQEAHKLLGV